MAKIVLDLSHWQGSMIDWQKIMLSGVKGVIIKASQGRDYADPMFSQNYAFARAVGLRVGAYHFMTGVNGLEQYAWFVKCVGDRELDFPPVMDAEISNVTETIVDVMGRKLIQRYGIAAIYTNKYMGDRIFKSIVMGTRYQLWIANWGVNTPALPKVWKDKPWMLWQRAVVDGAPYGIDGKVDYNEWGTAMPWPGAPEPPPPPATGAIVRLTYDGCVRTFEEVT